MSDLPVIDAALVRALLAQQFPQWAALPVSEASPQGWDNRTFRLGQHLAVRLPSAPGYAPQVATEHRWLPWLAAHLPLPVPAPVARGVPSALFGWDWSVYRWLPGRPLGTAPEVALGALAVDLADFLAALRAVPADGGPRPGDHNGRRGADFRVYAEEAAAAAAALDHPVARRAPDWLAAATASRWEGSPVWVHGDVAPGNLLVDDAGLCAVIDFGCVAVGDPACDLVPAWTVFDASSRPAFVTGVGLDPATWARARGWALWKAAITLASPPGAPERRLAERTLAELLADDPG